MPTIRLMLVDDHQLLLDTFAYMFNKEPDMRVIATQNSSKHLIERIKLLQPDIALLDINMEPLNGVEATKEIMKLEAPPKVIGVSFYVFPAYANKMMSAGAMGYVTKNSSRHELVNAVREVNNGRHFICQEMQDNMKDAEMGRNDVFNLLSQAEVDLIMFLKKGMSSKDIAIAKGVSHKTVEVHRYNMMRKVGASNVADLLNMAMARGL